MIKTNVMRILTQKKIAHLEHEYPHGDEAIDGVTCAKLMGMDEKKVFKTLVTQGASRRYYVFVIPVAQALDLKKAARAVKEKSVQMIPVSEIEPLTGYVRGGCSPVGMKKPFPTVIDQSCETLETMVVSAGKIGYQIELAPKDLLSLIRGQTADLVV